MITRNRIYRIFAKVYTAWIKATKKNFKYGPKLIVDPRTRIINKGKIELGENVHLRSISRGYQAGMPFPTTLLIDIPGAEIKIGAGSRINGVYIHAQKSIRIGSDCMIASGVNIMDSDGHRVHCNDRLHKRDTPVEIEIGNNVWIGLNAIILKGTKIGDNSVVGAGAIVKGNFPPNSIIVGNPAKVVKQVEIPE